MPIGTFSGHFPHSIHSIGKLPSLVLRSGSKGITHVLKLEWNAGDDLPTTFENRFFPNSLAFRSVKPQLSNCYRKRRAQFYLPRQGAKRNR